MSRQSRCPECDAVVEEDAVRCPNCKAPLGADDADDAVTDAPRPRSRDRRRDDDDDDDDLFDDDED